MQRAVVSEASRSDDLAQWMGQIAPLLRRYFRKRVSATEADDLVQDVLVAIIERTDHAPLDHTQGYLFEITAQLLAKSRTAPTGSSFEKIGAIANDFSPEHFAISHRERALVIAAIQKLSPAAGHAFILHRFENVTYTTIGRKLNVSVSAVVKLVAWALANITGELEPRQ